MESLFQPGGVLALLVGVVDLLFLLDARDDRLFLTPFLPHDALGINYCRAGLYGTPPAA